MHIRDFTIFIFGVRRHRRERESFYYFQNRAWRKDLWSDCPLCQWLFLWIWICNKLILLSSKAMQVTSVIKHICLCSHSSELRCFHDPQPNFCIIDCRFAWFCAFAWNVRWITKHNRCICLDASSRLLVNCLILFCHMNVIALYHLSAY